MENLFYESLGYLGQEKELEEFVVKEKIKADIEIDKLLENQQSSIAQENNPPCPNEPCNYQASTCCSFLVPPQYNPANLFTGARGTLAFKTDCLECRSERCLLPAVTTVNPCGGEPIQGVMEVNRVRVKGCIPFKVNYFGAIGNGIINFGTTEFPSFGIGATYLCCENCLCVDQTLCILPQDNDFCPNPSQTVGMAVLESFEPIPCGTDLDGGGYRVTFRITFTFPSCNGEAAEILSFRAIPSTVCAAGTGTNTTSTLFGYVVDENGTPIAGAEVTFTIDDPTLGSISPNPATTNQTGSFFVTFTAGTNTGTATITAEVDGVTASTQIQVIDCGA